MEPVNYALEGRSLLFPHNIELPLGTLATSKNILKDWNLNPFSDVDKTLYDTNQDQIIEITEFPESGVADILRKGVASNQWLEGVGAESADASKRMLLSTSVTTLDQIVGEVELHSDNRSNDPMSLPIGLKLEQLIDYGSSQSSKGSSVLSLAESLLPTEKAHHGRREEDSIVYREVKSNSSLTENSPMSLQEPLLLGKRSRTSNLHYQVPRCQVFGCHKDLSSSKDYHKRHKVCDEHSKTTTVIVNGIKQRFCQQCSRFHLLGEFDEGKRSCRKRLAGHNQRRRKPQFDTHWSSRLLEMTSQRRVPFLFPEISPGSFFPQGEHKDHCNGIKLEEKPICISQLATVVRKKQSPTKSLQHHHGMRKESSSRIHQELSAGQNSGGALSLLSAHSQHLLHNLENNFPYLKRDHSLENSYKVSASSRSNPSEVFGTERIARVLEDSQAVSPEVPRERHVRRSNILNSKSGLSPENAPTVDLVQLSSHLQRVEQLRSSVQSEAGK